MKAILFPCLHPSHSVDRADLDSHEHRYWEDMQLKHKTSAAFIWLHYQSGSEMKFKWDYCHKLLFHHFLCIKETLNIKVISCLCYWCFYTNKANIENLSILVEVQKTMNGHLTVFLQLSYPLSYFWPSFLIIHYIFNILIMLHLWNVKSTPHTY